MAPTGQSMDTPRQTKGSSLQHALAGLTEDSKAILGTAIHLEQRLVGNLKTPIVEPPSAQTEVKRIGEPPLLDSVEQQIRKALGQIREAGEILLSIERELS